MANYDLELENFQPPFLYGVGKIYEVKNGDVLYLVKSNTEYVRDDLIGNTPISHYRDLGNVFVSNFELLDSDKQDNRELDLTWLDKRDFAALRYNEDYEKVTSIKMNIDNLAHSYFPFKKSNKSGMTLVVDGSNTELSPMKQIKVLKRFIEISGEPFKDVKLIGFDHYIEGVLSRKSERKLRTVHRQGQKSKRLEI